jgi:hypothetical protein
MLDTLRYIIIYNGMLCYFCLSETKINSTPGHANYTKKCYISTHANIFCFEIDNIYCIYNYISNCSMNHKCTSRSSVYVHVLYKSKNNANKI